MGKQKGGKRMSAILHHIGELFICVLVCAHKALARDGWMLEHVRTENED